MANINAYGFHQIGPTYLLADYIQRGVDTGRLRVVKTR